MPLEFKEVSGDGDKKNSPDQKETVSVEQYNALLEKIEALSKNQPQQPQLNIEGLISSAVKSALEAVNSKNAAAGNTFDELKYRTVTMENIDAEDELETPVVFYGYNCGYLLVDYKKNGMNIRAPYSPIMLEHHSSKRTGKGREQDIVNYSKYVCKSKKELEFMRSHPFYGLIFHESKDKVEGRDYREAQKTVKYMTNLRNYGTRKVVEIATQNNIDISGIADDIEKIRLIVASSLAKKEIEQERVNARKTYDDQALEKFVSQQPE